MTVVSSMSAADVDLTRGRKREAAQGLPRLRRAWAETLPNSAEAVAAADTPFEQAVADELVRAV